MTVSGGTAPYTFSVARHAARRPDAEHQHRRDHRHADRCRYLHDPGEGRQRRDGRGHCPFTIDRRAVAHLPGGQLGRSRRAFNSPAMTVTGGTSPYTFSVARALCPAV